MIAEPRLSPINYGMRKDFLPIFPQLSSNKIILDEIYKIDRELEDQRLLLASLLYKKKVKFGEKIPSTTLEHF